MYQSCRVQQLVSISLRHAERRQPTPSPITNEGYIRISRGEQQLGSPHPVFARDGGQLNLGNLASHMTRVFGVDSLVQKRR